MTFTWLFLDFLFYWGSLGSRAVVHSRPPHDNAARSCRHRRSHQRCKHQILYLTTLIVAHVSFSSFKGHEPVSQMMFSAWKQIPEGLPAKQAWKSCSAWTRKLIEVLTTINSDSCLCLCNTMKNSAEILLCKFIGIRNYVYTDLV